MINTLNTMLNPICHLLALLGAHRILHVSRIRVNVIRLHLNCQMNPNDDTNYSVCSAGYNTLFNS
jgi:hypothetical protein